MRLFFLKTWGHGFKKLFKHSDKIVVISSYWVVRNVMRVRFKTQVSMGFNNANDNSIFHS